MKFAALFLASMLYSASAFAGGALICTSSSTGACKGRSYCCYEGSESDGDKACKKLGCVRGGTSSCPTAANVTSCGSRDKASLMPEQPVRPVSAEDKALPWCI
ncbi:MAG: hypothetical protein IT381_19870 [Deltaproteobacteria bacterium]|nr:hypothetical protein [Deltaproteobacteria bacterium]